MADSESTVPSWWRWPTILSLDAPAVTVLWQWQLAQASGVHLHWYHFTIVGTAVWLAYAADRWFESWRVPLERLRTLRHRFYGRHRWTTATLWLAALLGAVGLSLARLTARELAGGCLVLLPVLAYLLSHQLVHRGHPWRVPKEVCVAALLGAGAALFPACAPGVPVRSLLEAWGWFTALAFVNCALIGRWELAVDREQGQDSLVLRFPWTRRLVPVLPWLVIAAAAASWIAGSEDHRSLRAAALVSAGLLGAIDRAARRTGWPLARVLADAALLTPAFWLVASRLSP